MMVKGKKFHLVIKHHPLAEVGLSFCENKKIHDKHNKGIILCNKCNKVLNNKTVMKPEVRGNIDTVRKINERQG